MRMKREIKTQKCFSLSNLIALAKSRLKKKPPQCSEPGPDFPKKTQLLFQHHKCPDFLLKIYFRSCKILHITIMTHQFCPIYIHIWHGIRTHCVTVYLYQKDILILESNQNEFNIWDNKMEEKNPR